MTDFIAIDFETANGVAGSVCSVGAVMVRGGEVADTFYSLIHPEPDYYAPYCQRVHGLGHEDTDGAPLFPDVWHALEARLRDVYGYAPPPFVAHNARFDESQLRAAMRVYQMDWPGYTFLCTLRASRRLLGRRLPNHQLQTVAAACGYDLRNHHHALADAEACAAIALKLL
ncbi:MAG: 3'-5' exoribonuclease [Bacteroidaceae bacterium]|nr:3'-5' exoribonuclease [Bacteroidaceae bacterium]